MNKTYITLPCKPAKFVNNYTIDNVVIIEMSCGGGMGGSHWNEYIILPDLKVLSKSGLITVKNYLGEEMMLNTNNIVKVHMNKTITVAEVSHSNSNYDDNYRTMYFIHDNNVEPIILNDLYIPSNVRELSTQLKPINVVLENR